MNRDVMKSERLSICIACEHYAKDGHRCLKVAKPDDPTRKGYLDHPAGISNPYSQCPVLKWPGHFSSHALAVKELVPFPLLPELLRDVSRTGVNDFNIMALTNRLYKECDSRKLNIKRSDLLHKLMIIRRTPNQYKMLVPMF